MPDLFRNRKPDSPPEEMPISEHSIDEMLAGFPPARSLPADENPRLNRTAANIGTALGTTVVRMRGGISLVQERRREMRRNLAESMSHRAETFSAAMTERMSQAGDVVEDKASELFNRAQERLKFLREQARVRMSELGPRAATLRQERPLELIGAAAAAGFVLGVALKIWRSNHD